MSQPQMTILEKPDWLEGMWPTLVTQAPAVRQDPTMAIVPVAVRMLEFGVLGGCFDAGFQTRVEEGGGWGDLFVKVIDRFVEPVVRDYLCMTWACGGRGLESMVAFATAPPNGGALSFRTLAMRDGADPKGAAVRDVLAAAKPFAVVWLSYRPKIVALQKGHPSGQATSPGAIVQGDFVTPMLQGSIATEVGFLGEIRPVAAAMPREAAAPHEYIPFAPFCNLAELQARVAAEADTQDLSD